MDAIYNLLQTHRLAHYYNKFRDFGLKDERDFIDSITDEDLTNLGFSQLERNRFTRLQETIGRFRAPACPATEAGKKSMTSFSVRYTYPKCPEPKCIKDMDPGQNTVDDLMLRICHLESIDSSKGVCLFTEDGMPLTDDPFFNSWSLNNRHIKSGDVIYAIFTPKQNLLTAVPHSVSEDNISGTDTVRCHIMLKGDYEISADLEKDTISTLKKRLANESGIPAQVLHYIGDTGDGNTLESCGITEESTVHFSLSSFSAEAKDYNAAFTDDLVPSVKQTTKGISFLLSSLDVIKCQMSVDKLKNLIGYIRILTGCNPLAQSLFQLFCKNEIISRNQEIVVLEGLYTLFRELLPNIGTGQQGKTIEDLDVFEYSTHCWAYLLSEAKQESSKFENYAPYTLMNEEGQRFREPVTVPGVPGALERAAVLQKIKDGGKIPNCSENILRETSLKRDLDIEKMLLSVHPSVTTYHLWISLESATNQNFQIQTGKTLADMAEEMKNFSFLTVTPPLRLKEIGLQGPRLVHLSDNNVGVYLNKDKMTPQMIVVRDWLTRKIETVDVNTLAVLTGDQRDDQSFVTTRTPKEAILVLIDSSSSMAKECYANVKMQKIHAVKELFDNFASRTMAYDCHHVIGLLKFSSTVELVHTFTETLEKFKDYVRTIEASGKTKLYDALQHAKLELDKVKNKFPECRVRILCLTDGNDVGSSSNPADVAINLIKSDIIVDSVLLGNVDNYLLHGISIATGGCCFKPETSIDGLKLFENETVLSLQMRKLKNKADPSTITQAVLQGFFATHGYDTFLDVILPSQMTSKVTLTHKVLKKRIQEAKDGRFMDKEKRIMVELKSLHCDPHPYFTIFPSESDLTFWKILLEGPPETPYEKGVFELFCQFGPDYPVKPATVRFVTPIYHCNINSVGRICHNIFDRNYNAQYTMRDILDAVFGLLISPEPNDPLDSILAEEYLTNPEGYQRAAEKHTEEMAGKSLEDKEKELLESVEQNVPDHLVCPLTKKIFVVPVRTTFGRLYEQKAIQKHLKKKNTDPVGGNKEYLTKRHLMPDDNMKKMVKEYRLSQIQETYV